MSESHRSYHIAGFNGKASVRTSREYRRINERRKKKAMNKIIIDMPNKELNDAVKGKVQGMMESTEEIKPRASEVIDDDSIIGLGNHICRLIKEYEEMYNGKK